MTERAFTVRFRGVRGTIPTSGPATARYGGNTSCVEVRCGNRLIILDAGSGIRQLGEQLQDREMDILLSHTHIDHILGLPFFVPAYDSACTLRLWAGHLLPESTLKKALGQYMCPPLLPVTPEHFKAEVAFHDFQAGENLSGGIWMESGIRVLTLPLAHPDQATGYRIEYAGAALCYITDYEHSSEVPDAALAEFVRGADALIYDSTYSDEEFARYKGWGHSTWQQGVRLANAAGVKRLCVYHHDPSSDDAKLDAVAAKLAGTFGGGLMAKENVEISL